MPVRRCFQNGKSGYQWGESGKCYTYKSGDEESQSRAKAKAEEQGRAIHANQGRNK